MSKTIPRTTYFYTHSLTFVDLRGLGLLLGATYSNWRGVTHDATLLGMPATDEGLLILLAVDERLPGCPAPTVGVLLILLAVDAILPEPRDLTDEGLLIPLARTGEAFPNPLATDDILPESLARTDEPLLILLDSEEAAADDGGRVVLCSPPLG